MMNTIPKYIIVEIHFKKAREGGKKLLTNTVKEQE